MFHTHKFNTLEERNNYILSDEYEEPFVSIHSNQTIVSYNKESDNVIREYYTQQPLTFKVTSPGDIIWQGVGITIEYKKNDEEWSSITSKDVAFYSTQITVGGKIGTYTYGGYDSENGAYYWENGDDKLYGWGRYLEYGYYVNDSEGNEYEVLTSQYDISSTSTQITVGGKTGTYTYVGYDSRMDMYYWENNDDKLYGYEKYLEPGVYVYDSEWNEWEVLNSQYEKIVTLVSVVRGDVVQFRGNNAVYGDSENYSGNHFGGTAMFEVEGNIMSLIDSTGYATANTLSSAYTFAYLFYGCTGLTSAENLILPATTLANYCYYNMFQDCTRITLAPELPSTTLANYCYRGMFNSCTSLTTAPELPSTTLAYYCYGGMFGGCTSLISTPELPSTTLADYCYGGMFCRCTSLTSSPGLPATTLTPSCYQNMFMNCTSLTSAPELPATTLANECYDSMFAGCTSLTTAPELPATTLTSNCYYGMFGGCTGLTTAPELPATNLAFRCYMNLFGGCTSLTTAPELPATTLERDCYYYMFVNCTSLTTAPELPATTLAENCYYGMFQGCTSLTIAPSILPATTLAKTCYSHMFDRCTSLTSAPELPATTLADYCYSTMFYGCTNLNYIKCLAINKYASSTDSWVNGVSATGTFVKNASMTNWTTGVNGIPSGWTVVNSTFFIPLTFEIISGGTINWKKQGSPTERTIQYKLNGGTLTDLAPNNSINVASGDVVQFFGTADTYGTSTSAFNTFSGSTAKFNVEGNIMSLIDSNGYATATTLSGTYTFYGLFQGCTGLTSAENLILPATILTDSCYRAMFNGCTSLTTAPELSATTLAQNCYYNMFYGCTSLTTAPELPSTTLAIWLYQFNYST